MSESESENRPPPMEPTYALTEDRERELWSLGWEVVEIRPSIIAGGSARWRATITRRDRSATMSTTAADPTVAIDELTRYARADPTEPTEPEPEAA